MKPFDRNSSCPKCGSIDIRSNWFPHDDNRWLHHTIPAAKEKCEHIRRTCERCHYMWNEAPLDVEGGDDE